MLLTEAGAQTNWHQDFTGISVFLRCCQGQKTFLHFGKQWKQSKTFRQMATKWLQNIYFFWLPSPSDSSSCSAQKRWLSFPTEWVDALCVYPWGKYCVWMKYHCGKTLRKCPGFREGDQGQLQTSVQLSPFRTIGSHTSIPRVVLPILFGPKLRKMLEIINRLSQTSHPWHKFLYYYSETMTDLRWADIKKWLQQWKATLLKTLAITSRCFCFRIIRNHITFMLKSIEITSGCLFENIRNHISSFFLLKSVEITSRCCFLKISESTPRYFFLLKSDEITSCCYFLKFSEITSRCFCWNQSKSHHVVIFWNFPKSHPVVFCWNQSKSHPVVFLKIFDITPRCFLLKLIKITTRCFFENIRNHISLFFLLKSFEITSRCCFLKISESTPRYFFCWNQSKSHPVVIFWNFPKSHPVVFVEINRNHITSLFFEIFRNHIPLFFVEINRNYIRLFFWKYSISHPVVFC